MAKQKAVKAEAPETTKPAKARYVVVSPFNDRDDFGKTYAIDADVSHFDAERLREAQEKGLVKKATE